MHFVGEDELLELHPLLPQRLNQCNGLAERDISIIVAVDQQNRRPPPLNRSHGRRLESDTRRILLLFRIVRRRKIADDDVPVVHPMKIHASGKKVGCARQA